eukprot:2434851-Pleurochrysis_carterae.AAC.1
MRRWDFVAAYLQGDLEPGEVVYCHPSPGYETLGPDGKPRVTLPRCQAHLRYGASRASVAALALPMAHFLGLQAVTLRPMRVHVRAHDQRHCANHHHRLLCGRPL